METIAPRYWYVFLEEPVPPNCGPTGCGMHIVARCVDPSKTDADVRLAISEFCRHPAGTIMTWRGFGTVNPGCVTGLPAVNPDNTEIEVWSVGMDPRC
jgi:hypothetical protein